MNKDRNKTYGGDWKRWVDVVADRSIRVGQEYSSRPSDDSPRNEYQRDFDRMIFSSAFKRLQNKTQVFPLPGTAQVHNRLTHSLEVASVGRSLGSLVGDQIAKILEGAGQVDSEVVHFYRYELKDVILAACLAHDIGNPCFGHSGEKIISDYFTKLKSNSHLKDRKEELKKISSEEWADLTRFEGNANSLRMLTANYYGKLPGGLRLTYLTLASILKYPWSSYAVEKEHPTAKKKGNKYGFFMEQRDLVKRIADTFHLLPYSGGPPEVMAYHRHPFVYLVEAADDICYHIMDMEDAQRVSVLTFEEVEGHFLELYAEFVKKFFPERDDIDKMIAREEEIEDRREKVAYLRSKCINILTETAVAVFMDNLDEMGEGKADSLLDLITARGVESFEKIKTLSVERIYNYQSISEALVGASHILPELLDWFLPAILSPDTGEHTHQEKKLFSLITHQYSGGDFEIFKKKLPYERILILLDYLAGMTDEYITEWYRKLKGIDRPRLS